MNAVPNSNDAPMNCSPDLIRDYFFGELAAPQRAAADQHLANGCPACREELDSLSGVRASLLSITDEEPPRRIAFVSDKVFEPRWWQKMWNSSAQLGFAAAAMLAVAILVHGFAVRPATMIATAAPATQAGTAAASFDKAAFDAELDRRVKLEVARVLLTGESKQTERVLEVLNTKLRQTESQRSEDLVLIREYMERMEKRNALVTRRVLYE